LPAYRIVPLYLHDALPILSAQDEPLFDVIVSNPPYIDEEDEHLARLVAEPISALSAPNHGLADIAHIVKQAPQHLRKGGLLAIEDRKSTRLNSSHVSISYA